MADSGAGQQTPNDSTNDFNLTAFIVSQMMARLDTAKLVRVEKVTGGGPTEPAGTVDVLPLVNQIDGDGNKQEHGTVYGIPWSRVQGGTNAIICDPVVGDIGYVVAMDRDSSIVKETKKQANPGSFRKYNIADGIYAGGALNVAPDQYLVFSETAVRLVDKNGNKVELTSAGVTLTDKTGNVLAMSASGIDLTPFSGLPVTVHGQLVVTNGLQVTNGIQLSGSFTGIGGGTYSGDLLVGGDVVSHSGTGLSVSLDSHTHRYDRPTGASAPAQSNAPTAGT